MERATEHRRDGLCNESFRAQPGSRRYRCVRPEGHSGAHEIAPVGAAHERRVMEQVRSLESRLAAAEARVHRVEEALMEACDWLYSYEDPAACEDEVRALDAFMARARTLLAPTTPPKEEP